MTPFLKMHGLGNDFVVFDARNRTLSLDSHAARAIADRRLGIGCDQVIVIEEEGGDEEAFMRIYNADGAEVENCGNAARCVARLLMDESGTDHLRLGTEGAPLRCYDANGLVTIDIGAPRFDWRDIPMSKNVDTKSFELSIPPPLVGGGECISASEMHSGEGVHVTSPLPQILAASALEFAPSRKGRGMMVIAAAVNVGNPHCVLFIDEVSDDAVHSLGRAIEHHPMFPQRTNVEFVQVLSPDRLRMRVWERGAGVTLACGTGACAAAVAAQRRGLCSRKVEVVLDGGTLTIEWAGGEDDHVFMTGPTALSFRGEIDLEALA